jgi:hypothetical protein
MGYANSFSSASEYPLSTCLIMFCYQGRALPSTDQKQESWWAFPAHFP